MGWNICSGRRGWFSLEQKQLRAHLTAAPSVYGEIIKYIESGLYSSTWWKTQPLVIDESRRSQLGIEKQIPVGG